MGILPYTSIVSPGCTQGLIPSSTSLIMAARSGVVSMPAAREFSMVAVFSHSLPPSKYAPLVAIFATHTRANATMK